MAKGREKVTDNPAKGVTWDLSELYTSIDDPKIEKDKKGISLAVNKFNAKYKGGINKDTNSENLANALKEYENIFVKLSQLGLYTALLFSSDTSNTKIKALNQKVEEFENEIRTKLLWFDLAWIKLPDKKAKLLLSSNELARYHYYLERLRTFKPFTLSEKEEQILTKKAQTSGSAFVRFFDEKTASLRFPLRIDGEKKELSISELSYHLSQNPDRKARILASKAFTDVLSDNANFYTFTLNTLLLDKKVNDEIRGYKYPQQATLLGYDVKREVVDAMVKAVTNNTEIVSKYYRTKKKLQKLKSLHEWDRYSPLYPQFSKSYSWTEAKDLVLKAFYKPNNNLGEIAESFFDNKHIDAELRKNKRDGAFCAYGTPKIPPFILSNFNGELDEVTTLAHELGHGVHGILAQRENTFLQARPSTATAEIASVFSESMTFDLLLESITDTKTKLNYLANKMEGIFATIFRQTQFYLFETDIHTHRREVGELSTEDFNNYYQKRLQSMFGDSLTLTEGHQYWWMYILHFYHYNFYVFTYAFGELLSQSLYAKYKQDGSKFMDNYIEALKAGGSKSPAEITAMMGVDISDPNFWNKGLDLLENYVAEFEQLAATV